MSYKYVGERYDRSLSLKEIAKRIRDYAKSDEILGQCKWSVSTSYASMCQTLHIKLMEAPFEAFTDSYRDYERWYGDAEYCTKEANEVMCRMRDYVESYNYDDSDRYTDYFTVNFYTHYGVGEFEKPFKKVIKKNKRNKATSGRKQAKGGELHLIDYTDKSCVVYGDTYPIKEVLKAMGGKFSSHLDIDGRCGWVFQITQKDSLKMFFNI